jgi:ribosomal protein L37AE/L43A
MDELDGAEPRCSTEGIVMRDIPGGWQCPSCGEVVAPVMQMPVPPRFHGAAIRGG